MAVQAHEALVHYLGVAAEAILIRMEQGAVVEFDGANYHLRADAKRITPISESVLIEMRRRKRFTVDPIQD